MSMQSVVHLVVVVLLLATHSNRMFYFVMLYDSLNALVDMYIYICAGNGLTGCASAKDRWDLGQFLEN